MIAGMSVHIDVNNETIYTPRLKISFNETLFLRE